MSVARNTIYNALGGMFPMLVALITVPLYIRFIGAAEYGILTIAWLLMGYSTYAEFGFGQGVANEIARLGNQRAEECNRVFWTGFLSTLIFGLALGLVITALGYAFVPHWPTLAIGLRVELLRSLPWLIAAGPLAAGSSVLQSAIESRHHFKQTNIIQSIGGTLSQGLPLVAVLLGQTTLPWLVGFAVFGRAITFLLLFVALWVLLPLQWGKVFDRGKLGFLFGFGGWVTISNIAETFLSSLDRWIAGAFLGPDAVAYYAVPANLATRTAIFPVALVRTVFPRFSSMDRDRALLESLRATIYLGRALAIMMAIGIIVVGPFLKIWVGVAFAKFAMTVAPILFLAAWVRSIAYIPDVFLRATRRPQTVALARVVEIPILLGLGWLGFKWFGLPGIAWAWCLRVCLDAGWLWKKAGHAKVIAKHLLLPATALGMIYLVMTSNLSLPHIAIYGISAAILLALAVWTIAVDGAFWLGVFLPKWRTWFR